MAQLKKCNCSDETEESTIHRLSGTLAQGSRIFGLKGEPFFEGSNSRAFNCMKYHEMYQNMFIRISISCLFSS